MIEPRADPSKVAQLKPYHADAVVEQVPENSKLSDLDGETRQTVRQVADLLRRGSERFLRPFLLGGLVSRRTAESRVSSAVLPFMQPLSCF